MEVTVIRAGMLTTVQDLGRAGHRACGVPLGGAADPFALRVANLLVGNPESSAAFEITLAGPELEFADRTVLALCGAEFDGVPSWHPFELAAGERLRFGACRRGCRGYLAVAGGIAVEPVLGGRGTCLSAGFGGWQGRPLRDGDLLGAGEPVRRLAAPPRWAPDPRMIPEYSAEPVVRILRGSAGPELFQGLVAGRFRVGSHSDRMGIRLEEPALPGAPPAGSLVSAPVAPGTVQVPPDGRPIVLLSDAQTLGGYARAAHAIGPDLPLLAQLRPNDHVRFREVGLAQAHAAAIEREHSFTLLRRGIAQKFA